MSLTQIKLPGTIYGSSITHDSHLILDVRDAEKQIISYWSLNMQSFQLEKLSIRNNEWWTKLISCDSTSLYLTKYKDRTDPNSKVNLKVSIDRKDAEEVKEIPSGGTDVNYPVLYEVESDYHKTVSDFLGLELPLSCEYLEWKGKIIISYYLRSDNAFDRFLLLLDNGKKEWKLHQDHQMKGFSTEAFFLYNDQLIFFKDLNEVCIYNL